MITDWDIVPSRTHRHIAFVLHAFASNETVLHSWRVGLGFEQAQIQRCARCTIELQYLDPLISCLSFVLVTLQSLLPTENEVIYAYLDVISIQELVTAGAYLQSMGHIAINSTV